MTFATYFNPGVSLQGGSGSGSVSLPISGDSATVTTNTPLVDGTQTWNNAATTFTALKINVTDTASNAASLLMDLQIGGTSQFKVSKGGRIDTLYGVFGGFVFSPIFRVYSNTGELTFGTSSDVFLTRDAAGVLSLRGSSTTTPGAMSFYTYGASPPAAPAASIVRLYADTSGGKIRLMAIFPTGVAQQIAIEP
jgi:hypothetical protein